MPDQETLERLEKEALDRYERAVKLAADTRAEWEAIGSPLLYIGHNDIEYEHPLVKLLREAEKDAAARLKDVPKPAGKPGRKPVGVPGITKSPAAARRTKLRAVK